MPRPRLAARPLAPRDQRLPRGRRVRKRPDFLRIQRSGRRVHTPHFVIIVAPAERQRIGITVTRRVARAVGRNRIKRLVREVFRRNREAFPDGSDIVVVARAGAEQLDYAGVRAELTSVAAMLSRATRRKR